MGSQHERQSVSYRKSWYDTLQQKIGADCSTFMEKRVHRRETSSTKKVRQEATEERWQEVKSPSREEVTHLECIVQVAHLTDQRPLPDFQLGYLQVIPHLEDLVQDSIRGARLSCKERTEALPLFVDLRGKSFTRTYNLSVSF